MRRPKHTLNSQKLRFLSLEPILAPDMRVVSVDPGVNKKNFSRRNASIMLKKWVERKMWHFRGLFSAK